MKNCPKKESKRPKLVRKYASTRLKDNPIVRLSINMFQWDISIKKMDKMKNVEYERLKSSNISWSALNNLRDTLKVTFHKKTDNTLLLKYSITFQYSIELHQRICNIEISTAISDKLFFYEIQWINLFFQKKLITLI